jgi:hypothetical protein
MDARDHGLAAAGVGFRGGGAFPQWERVGKRARL